MTVDASAGDAEGDLVASSPVLIGEVSDPAPACKGKFWAISESSNEGSDGEEGGETSASSRFSFRYVCRSPSPVSGRDLQVSAGASQRAARRARRQSLQKEAALVFASPMTDPCEETQIQLNVKHQRSYKEVNHPVLEPSSFPDDGAGGWTVVRRKGKMPAITGPGDAQIRGRSSVSNGRACGPQMINQRGPLAAELSPKSRRDRMRMFRVSQAAAIPTPNLVAGRAFRHLLGYTWCRKTLVSTEDRPIPATEMNRGTGRAPGRGGDRRGRQYQGVGNGRGGGRFAGTNPFPRQRNFVQGESSGSAAWDDHGGDRFHDNNADGAAYGSAGGFGNGGFGSFHRGSGYGYNARRNFNQYQRRGSYQPRNQPAGVYRAANSRSTYAAGADGVRRESGIDQELLQQTVQAVVAAVTAASKTAGNTTAEVTAPATVIPTGTQTDTAPVTSSVLQSGFEVENTNLNVEIEMAEDPQNDGNNNDGNGGNGEDGKNENNRDDVTHMEVEQTMNPGANQGVVGNNSNNASFKQNSLVVTFGTLPPSPIKEDVSLPCVFTAELDLHKMSEGTEIFLSQNGVQNENLHQISAQPQKDRKVADFEMDSVLDHVPIIGDRPIIEDRPIIGARGSSSRAVQHRLLSAESEPTASASSLVQDSLLASGQVEGAGQSGDDTRLDRGETEAGSGVPSLNAQEAGFSAPHNGVVVSAPEVNCDANLNISFDLAQNYDVNLISTNDQSGGKLNGATFASNTTVMKNDAVVGLDQNNICSYDSFGFSSIDAIDIVKNIDQPLDGVANNVQKTMPKKSKVPTEEEVIAFGGIAPTIARSSVRLQRKDNADDDVMDKAMKLAQQRVAPIVTGTHESSNLSFIDKDSSEIIELASRLGVSLGKNVHEAVQTVDNIKRVEESRNVQYLQKSIDYVIEGDNGPSNLVMSNVSALCEDLVDDDKDFSDVEDLTGDPLPPIKEKKLRQIKAPLMFRCAFLENAPSTCTFDPTTAL
ncbi:hypothetical protein ACQ4PT_040044 [Festuca glaucescens]